MSFSGWFELEPSLLLVSMVVGVMPAQHLGIPFFPQGMSLRGRFSPQMKGMIGRSDANHRLAGLHPFPNRFHLGYLWCSPANAHKEQIGFGQSLLQTLQVVSSSSFPGSRDIACGESQGLQFGLEESGYRIFRLVFPFGQDEGDAWSCRESRAAR